ncbi:MAG: cation-transporting P-type ATPase [Candidatus Kapabacteria bacterium]|nr:cation-transporting P-type ATPase [Candidatus Kapabacteria bacterium]
MRGLSHAEAQERLRRYGPNALPEQPPETLWRKALRQLQSPLVYILLGALALDLLFWLWKEGQGVPLESAAIAGILLLNVVLGTVQEWRSEHALRQLKRLAQPWAWVLRDGRFRRIPARELVPGDLVRLEAGDRIPADGRAMECSGVLVDESILTGESVPVEKGIGDELSAGTLLVRGRVLLQVERTGMQSAMGRIAELLGRVTESKTPLEQRLERFGRWVALLVLILAVLVFLLGWGIAGRPSRELLLFAVALAVAAVPEGLPAALTLSLALGVQRMSRRRAVVRRLAAVEALGSVTAILTDKTGTLTENRMRVQRLIAPDHERALVAMVVCNDADLATGAGDPLELALLEYAAQSVSVEVVRREYPRIAERPFDSAWKFMRVTTPRGSFFKGAPESLLPRLAVSDQERSVLAQEAGQYAAKGYRVITLAYGEGEREDRLGFLGFVLLQDPPRPEVPQAVQEAQRAGIHTVMLTGDHPATARAVAERVGIPTQQVVTGEQLAVLTDEELVQANIFARVAPEDKLRIVMAFRRAGHVVAVTGDGVNDAPALKHADVAVAMGVRGSDVAREVADIVLLDDNFATIVAAVEEGRSIYENIQKFLRFLFAINFAEILLVAVGMLWLALSQGGIGQRELLVPLTAVQILWINLVTNGLPALALAADRNPDVLSFPPRPKQSPLLDRHSLRFILSTGVVGAAIGMGLLVGLSPVLGYAAAQSATFHFMALGQLLCAYAARRTHVRPLQNWLLHGAIGASYLLQLLLGEFFPEIVSAVRLPLWTWGLVLGASLAVWLLAEGASRLLRYLHPVATDHSPPRNASATAGWRAGL